MLNRLAGATIQVANLVNFICYFSRKMAITGILIPARVAGASEVRDIVVTIISEVRILTVLHESYNASMYKGKWIVLNRETHKSSHVD